MKFFFGWKSKGQSLISCPFFSRDVGGYFPSVPAKKMVEEGEGGGVGGEVAR